MTRTERLELTKQGWRTVKRLNLIFFGVSEMGIPKGTIDATRRMLWRWHSCGLIEDPINSPGSGFTTQRYRIPEIGTRRPRDIMDELNAAADVIMAISTVGSFPTRD